MDRYLYTYLCYIYISNILVKLAIKKNLLTTAKDNLYEVIILNEVGKKIILVTLIELI